MTARRIYLAFAFAAALAAALGYGCSGCALLIREGEASYEYAE